eukprot:111312-Rhodomonas_salina.1
MQSALGAPARQQVPFYRFLFNARTSLPDFSSMLVPGTELRYAGTRCPVLSYAVLVPGGAAADTWGAVSPHDARRPA